MIDNIFVKLVIFIGQYTDFDRDKTERMIAEYLGIAKFNMTNCPWKQLRKAWKQ